MEKLLLLAVLGLVVANTTEAAENRPLSPVSTSAIEASVEPRAEAQSTFASFAAKGQLPSTEVDTQETLDFLKPQTPTHASCFFSSCQQARVLCRTWCNECPSYIYNCFLSACSFECVCQWQFC